MKVNTENIRYFGRWFLSGKSAVATAPGSHFYLAFSGCYTELHFDTEFLTSPPPHLWVSIDDGNMVEVPIDRHLRLQTAVPGNHIARVIIKSSITNSHRWYSPLTGRVEFTGWDGMAGVLHRDTKKIIEFVGDSITEGVFVDENLGKGLGWEGRVYQDDAAATYSWLTAQRLGFEPVISAYGSVGVTECGGTVPKAADFYPFCFNKAPVMYSNADYTVMNYGANDRAHSSEEFIFEYNRLLDVVAKHNPKSELIVLQPFCGAFGEELMVLKDAFVHNSNRKLSIILTDGWIPEEPLHPSREIHILIAEKLVNALHNLGVS